MKGGKEGGREGQADLRSVSQPEEIENDGAHPTDRHLSPSLPPAGQHLLLPRPFDFGAAAYIVSRAGMERILELYFTDETENSLVRPQMRGSDLIIIAYYEAVGRTYVVFPSLFTVEGEDSTIAGEGEEKEVRLGRQGRSNERHWRETRGCGRGGGRRGGSGGGREGK